jgi:hypothetical protein
MRKLTQRWKLRRSFGSQPVGNVDGPRWPEVARGGPRWPEVARGGPRWPEVARGGPRQASPPRRSRPNRRAGPCGARLILTADLPTCRLGRGRPSGCPLTRSPLTVVQAFPQSSTPKLGISLQADHPDHASPSKAQQLFERLLRYHRSAQSSLASFPLEIARNQELSGCSRSVRFSIFDNLFILKIQRKIKMGLNI